MPPEFRTMRFPTSGSHIPPVSSSLPGTTAPLTDSILTGQPRRGPALAGMRRVVIPELLDEDQGTSAEIAASLADLRRINLWFGGTATTIALLRRVAVQCGSAKLSLLEVAAGDGYMPLAAQRSLAGQGMSLNVTLLDRQHSHLHEPAVPAVSGDARQLPFRDGAFDVVSCSLFAHHLEPDELCQFAAEALRVCRHAVLINDLIRSSIHLALVYAGTPLFRSRLTRHDAPASVCRAYTINEMYLMLRSLPAARVEITRHFLYRMGVLVWKRSS
jgi:methyltransferase family protein